MLLMRRTVVGVFDDPAQAELAVDALQDACFSLEQISLSSHDSESQAGEHHKSGFLEALKQLFVGKDTSETDGAPSNIESDLTSMGLSEEAARYYEEQYNLGKSVIAVRAEDRVEEALGILRIHGGHDFDARPGVSQAEAARYANEYEHNIGVAQPQAPVGPDTVPPTGMEREPVRAASYPTMGQPEDSYPSNRQEAYVTQPGPHTGYTQEPGLVQTSNVDESTDRPQSIWHEETSDVDEPTAKPQPIWHEEE
jgi:hypothetical protein